MAQKSKDLKTPFSPFGAYERWVVARGARYDFPALRLVGSPYLTYLVESVGGASFETARATTDMQSQGSWDFRLPPLWVGNINGETFQPQFLPFVAVNTAKDGFEFSNFDGAEFARAFAQASEESNLIDLNNPVQSVSPKGNAANLELFFRLNYPVLTSSLNEGKVEWDNRVDLGLTPNSGTHKDTAEPLVIQAIIDDGIPFAHANFRRTDLKETRIDFCWAQDATALQSAVPKKKAGNGPKTPVLFGREFTRKAINKLIADNDGNEDAIYSVCGATSSSDTTTKSLAHLHSHGAHVGDLLAGRWAEDRQDLTRIIAVSLPSNASWDTSGFGSDMYVLNAMHYIFRRADDMHRAYVELHKDKKVPPTALIVNLSYGVSGGPHDGSLPIEAAMQEMVEHRRSYAPTALVMPSGNHFTDSLHAVLLNDHFETKTKAGTKASEKSKKGGQEKVSDLHVMLQPDDRTSTFIELWLPEGQTHTDVKLELVAPGGRVVRLEKVKSSTGRRNTNPSQGVLREREIIVKPGTDSVGRVADEMFRNNEFRYVIALAPTAARPSAKLPSAPAGLWKIRLTLPSGSLNDTFPAGTGRGTSKIRRGINAYVQRDESFGLGNTGARQAYFVDLENQPFRDTGEIKVTDSVKGLKPQSTAKGRAKVRRFGSINGMATAKSTIVVGSTLDKPRYKDSKGQAAPFASSFSGGGALRYILGGKGVGRLNKPVAFAAPSERNPFERGIVAASTRSGATITRRGTSSSAPQIARVLTKALEQQTDPATDPKLWQADSYYIQLINTSLQPVSSNWETAHPAGDERLGGRWMRHDDYDDRPYAAKP